MKTFFLIVVLLFYAIADACRDAQPAENRIPVKGLYQTDIVQIDGCQYIENRQYDLIHKGDCNNPIHACNPASKKE